MISGLYYGDITLPDGLFLLTLSFIWRLLSVPEHYNSEAFPKSMLRHPCPQNTSAATVTCPFPAD